MKSDATCQDIIDNVRVRHNSSTFAFVLSFSLPLATATELRAIDSHLVEETTDHMFPVFSLTVAFIFVPLLSAGFSLVTVMLLPLLFSSFPSFFHLTPIRLLGLSLAVSFFIQDSDNHSGCSASFADLKEGVIMT